MISVGNTSQSVLSLFMRAGAGPTPVRPQGPVRSPLGPEPMKVGPVHPLTGLDTWTCGLGPVRTQVREGQDRTPDSLHRVVAEVG